MAKQAMDTIEKIDPINRMIPLSVISLSRLHCINNCYHYNKTGFEEENENCFQVGECRESYHIQGSYLTDEFAW